MAFGVSANRSLASRGPSPGFRFALYAILSVTLMVLDQRARWLGGVRYVLQATAYPVQLAVSSPSAAWRWLQEAAETRESLRADNERLRARQRELEVRTLRYDALARENAELRGLRKALPPVAEKWLVAEVMNVEPNRLRQSVLVNRGTRNGVFEAQAVLDDQGLIGQTVHVGPWSAEVILITDPEHALPVQIERTGLRTIAVGTGSGLALPYLPANADVKVGDLLITSGLGGVFPHGYPVGRVTAVQREVVQPMAQVRAAPLARLDRAREVMLLWFRPEHPAAPGTTSGADLEQGDVKAQAQALPQKPKPAPPAPAPTSASTAAVTTHRETAAATSAVKPASGQAEPAAAPQPGSRTGARASGARPLPSSGVTGSPPAQPSPASPEAAPPEVER